MFPHMPFPNCRRLAKLRHAGSMSEFGCAFLYRCNHLFFGHGLLLKAFLLKVFLPEAFSNKKATLRWLKFRIFGFTRRIGAGPPSAVGFVLQNGRGAQAPSPACDTHV